MSTPDTPAQQVRGSEEITEDVKKLASDIRTLESYTTAAGLIGTAIGSIVAIPFGPIAFLSGAALGAAVTGGLKAYASSRKKELEKEIETLQASGQITESIAAELKGELGAIHTDDPKKMEGSINELEQTTKT